MTWRALADAALNGETSFNGKTSSRHRPALIPAWKATRARLPRATYERVLGETHPGTLTSCNLAGTYRAARWLGRG